MKKRPSDLSLDYLLLGSIIFLVIFGTIALKSLAPSLFPLNYLYILLAVIAFVILIQIDFDILLLFSKHFYVLSIILLLAPLFIGQVTRGAIRWIPIGALTIQPAEIVRPFLMIFFANYLTEKKPDLRRLFKAIFLLLLPVVLVFIQPSLGVAILILVGFVGVLAASEIRKKYLLIGLIVILFSLPIIWQIMAPYQKTRIETFINPGKDPFGAGYNSLQSMISVGSGKLLGRGLGKGVQTQLAFLPERHTDFVFASIAEEFGFLGAFIILLGEFLIFWRIAIAIEKPKSFAARAFSSGIFLSLFVQTSVHVGMNMGLLPITGVPLPLVSGGGSSLLATSIALAMISRCSQQIRA